MGAQTVEADPALMAFRAGEGIHPMGSVDIAIDDAVNESYTFHRFGSWVMGC